MVSVLLRVPRRDPVSSCVSVLWMAEMREECGDDGVLDGRHEDLLQSYRASIFQSRLFLACNLGPRRKERV
jgi:hypothetical protein